MIYYDTTEADRKENLFAILEQGTITRPTFFELLRNPVVQLTRHITDDDVSNWESWIEATNVYRDREQKKEAAYADCSSPR